MMLENSKFEVAIIATTIEREDIIFWIDLLKGRIHEAIWIEHSVNQHIYRKLSVANELSVVRTYCGSKIMRSN